MNYLSINTSLDIRIASVSDMAAMNQSEFSESFDYVFAILQLAISLYIYLLATGSKHPSLSIFGSPLQLALVAFVGEQASYRYDCLGILAMSLSIEIQCKLIYSLQQWSNTFLSYILKLEWHQGPVPLNALSMSVSS